MLFKINEFDNCSIKLIITIRFTFKIFNNSIEFITFKHIVIVIWSQPIHLYNLPFVLNTGKPLWKVLEKNIFVNVTQFKTYELTHSIYVIYLITNICNII